MASNIGTTDMGNYAGIADAIRELNGSADMYTPAEMPAAIRALPSEIEGIVHYDEAQDLTDAEQEQARDNIGAQAAITGAENDAVVIGADGTPAAVTPDAEPTADSDNLVTSGGVAAADAALLEKIISIYPTATVGPAEVVSFDDGADGIPVKAISVESSEETTTVTRIGKNWINPNMVTPIGSVDFSVDDEGGLVVVNNSSVGQYPVINMRYWLPAGTYTFSRNGSNYRVMLSSDDYNHPINTSNPSYTLTYDGTSYLRIMITTPIAAGATRTIKWQCESGSEATEWEKYLGEDFSIPAQSGEVTTVLGINHILSRNGSGSTQEYQNVTVTYRQDIATLISNLQSAINNG